MEQLFWHNRLAHASADGTALVTGLRRLALVLAIAGASLGELIGYVATENCHSDTSSTAHWVTTCSGPNPGSIALGIMAGFTVVWVAASVVIWIIHGF
jgi:hypothetical protein